MHNHVVAAELQGTVVAFEVGAGDSVGERTVVALVESTKLHHEVRAGVAGTDEWFEIDDVIDPADTRRWLTGLLDSVPPRPPGPVRPQIDTW